MSSKAVLPQGQSCTHCHSAANRYQRQSWYGSKLENSARGAASSAATPSRPGLSREQSWYGKKLENSATRGGSSAMSAAAAVEAALPDSAPSAKQPPELPLHSPAAPAPELSGSSATVAQYAASGQACSCAQTRIMGVPATPGAHAASSLAAATPACRSSSSPASPRAASPCAASTREGVGVRCRGTLVASHSEQSV